MIDYILIADGELRTLACSETDNVVVPDDCSLIAPDVWATICQEAGGEPALIAELGVRDMREEDVWQS